MGELIESISKMIVQGNRLELPTEQLTNYPEVKKAMIKAGGKYKNNGFTFTTDALSIQNRLVQGENIDDKKKFQFFATPEKVAKAMIELATLEDWHRVLEPSAGTGDIAMHIPPWIAELIVVEINPACIEVLSKYYQGFEEDFLTLTEEDLGMFDRIIANPPFTKNQDIDHVKHMYELLNPGGRIVSIMGTSWRFGSQKKQVDFRNWINSMIIAFDAEIIELDADTFKESGTNVSSVIVLIKK